MKVPRKTPANDDSSDHYCTRLDLRIGVNLTSIYHLCHSCHIVSRYNSLIVVRVRLDVAPVTEQMAKMCAL